MLVMYIGGHTDIQELADLIQIRLKFKEQH